jgi:hypothetical protein
MVQDDRFSDLWARIGPDFREVALEELDRVPRSDPFWTGTNNGATESKAINWFNKVLQQDPSNDRVRWLLIGFSVSRCTSAFYELFRSLVRADPSNLRWLMEADEYVDQMAGGFGSDQLRPTLLDLQGDPGD